MQKWGPKRAKEGSAPRKNPRGPWERRMVAAQPNGEEKRGRPVCGSLALISSLPAGQPASQPASHH